MRILELLEHRNVYSSGREVKRARLASGLSLKTPHGSAVSRKVPWRSVDKYSMITNKLKIQNLVWANSEEIRPVGKKLSSIYSQYAYRNAYEAS